MYSTPTYKITWQRYLSQLEFVFFFFLFLAVSLCWISRYLLFVPVFFFQKKTNSLLTTFHISYQDNGFDSVVCFLRPLNWYALLNVTSNFSFLFYDLHGCVQYSVLQRKIAFSYNFCCHKKSSWDSLTFLQPVLWHLRWLVFFECHPMQRSGSMI